MAISALVLELVEGPSAGRSHRARADSACGGAGDRAADCGSAGRGARKGHRASRSQARQYQGPTGWHGEGPGLRAGEGHDRRGRGTDLTQSPTMTATRRVKA